MNRILIAALAGSSLLLGNAAHAQQSRQAPSSAASERPLTRAERQAAWSSNRTEYQRRVVRYGQRDADRWLDQRALALRGKPKAQPRAGARTKNCKKVRWVNRATPGFGGGPMTMSRVAVCAD